MRAVIATASNDHRLGANEAPPAIISVYLGSQIEDLLTEIKNGTATGSTQGGTMKLGVDTLPEFEKDPGDRNRTSPFAFTGNRFEFRAVGSNQSVSGPLVALNTILSDSLNWIADQLEAELAKGSDQKTATYAVVKSVMDQHSVVVFGGNGYSEEWHKMAVEERGLLNLPTTADALPFLKDPAIVALFADSGVLSNAELESRFEVYAEQYVKVIEMEATLVINMAKTIIYPASVRYLSELCNSIAGLKEIGISLDDATTKKVASLTESMMETVSKLDSALVHESKDITDHMQYSAKTLRPLMDKVREYADELEGEIADDLWALPKYQEMLFIK